MMKHWVAVDSRGGFAKNGSIPWDLPPDLDRFRLGVFDQQVLMGSKTFRDIGRPIGVVNYVLTSQKLESDERIRPVKNLRGILELFTEPEHAELCVIGGESVYRSTMKETTVIDVTRINKDFKCDRFYPGVPADFALTWTSGPLEHNGIEYSHNVYERLQK